MFFMQNSSVVVDRLFMLVPRSNNFSIAPNKIYNFKITNALMNYINYYFYFFIKIKSCVYGC